MNASAADALLLICADALDDLERVRIANENRLRSLRDVKGLDGSAAEAKLDALTQGLADLEHQAALDLKRAMRAHPLGPWVKASVGVGEKQGARLIAAVGDPYIRAAEYDEDGNETAPARPRRGPAELWAYCGYDPKQKRQKGVKSNWNAQAKMRAYLCAEAAVKAGVRKLDECDDTDGYDVAGREAVSPLGQVYLDARASWADRDTSDGHKHNHALRRVAKEILKDLWKEARRLHAEVDCQTTHEPAPSEDREADA